jgi:telomerase protein component 1
LSRELTESIKFKFSDFDEFQLGKYCSEGRRKRKMLKRKRLREREMLRIENETTGNKHIPSKWKVEGNVLVFTEKKVGEVKPGRRRVVSRGGRGRGAGRGMMVRGRGGKMMKMNPRKAAHAMKHREVPQTDLDKEIAKNTNVNMKRLVKICKIKQPKLLVRKVLGQKYPDNEEEYLKLVEEDCAKYGKKLSEQTKKFDPLQAGKRMKIDIPKTWEVEITKKGNKKEVWEDLVENKNLPILATIRNLRNIINSETNETTHNTIVNQISDFDTIVKSRMMPFQFYSAYKELQKLEVQKQSLKELYSNAIENALKISTANNITKLPGRSLIFVDVSGSMDSRLSGHSEMTLREAGILLALMINVSCEKVEFRAFSSPGQEPKGHILVNINKVDILKNFEVVNQYSRRLGGGTDVPSDRLYEALNNNERFDNIFIISDMMINGHGNKDLKTFLDSYRQKVNPMMKYVAINLNSYGIKLDDNSDMLNIHITGFSDKILSIVAEADPKTQIEKIKEICQEELKLKQK